MVDVDTSQQAEQLYRLDGQQGDDAPDSFRRQITDGNQQKAVAGIEHQDVTIVEGHVDKPETKQQAHAPGKPT